MRTAVAAILLLIAFGSCTEDAYKGTQVVSVSVKEEPSHEELFSATGPISDEDRAALLKLEEQHPAIDSALLTGNIWEVKSLRATASPETEEQLNLALGSEVGKKLAFGPEGVLRPGRDLQPGGKWTLSGDTLTHYLGNYDAYVIRSYRIIDLNAKEMILLTLYAEDDQRIFSYYQTSE